MTTRSADIGEPLAEWEKELLDEQRILADLDTGIREYVEILRRGRVETFESCQGGDGHSAVEPTIWFHGQRDAGWHALHIAQEVGLPVRAIRRAWPIVDGEPTGPYWEMVFKKMADR